MPEIIKIDPLNPEPSLILKAARILRDGGVIAYPTETFYGLGVDASNEKAIERIYTIKGRVVKKPISIIIGSQKDLNRFAVSINRTGKKLMKEFWPGGLTLIFKASGNISEKLTAGTGKIGIRLSSNVIATSLAETLRVAITATSANISGDKEYTSAGEITESLGNRIDAIIDGGKTPGTPGSTIVDVTGDMPVVLREGVVSSSAINKITGMNSR
jgi:L-threonylcarbamoyladenylate synthase